MSDRLGRQSYKWVKKGASDETIWELAAKDARRGISLSLSLSTANWVLPRQNNERERV